MIPPKLSIPQGRPIPIKSLCEALKSPPSTIGFIQDDCSEYHLSLSSSGALTQTNTLDQLLATTSADQALPRLKRRQRYRLALTLASSFVQLGGTAWLASNAAGGGESKDQQRTQQSETQPLIWSKQSVHFLVPVNVDSAPFVERGFEAPDGPDDRPVGDNTNDEMAVISSIATLGILLLELCFGTAIEAHPARLRFPRCDDGSTPSHLRAAFDLVAALEWLKDVHDEAGADFADAVEWCLAGCRRGVGTTASGGVSRQGIAGEGAQGGAPWRRGVLEKVVAPLERCYGYLG